MAAPTWAPLSRLSNALMFCCVFMVGLVGVSLGHPLSLFSGAADLQCVSEMNIIGPSNAPGARGATGSGRPGVALHSPPTYSTTGLSFLFSHSPKLSQYSILPSASCPPALDQPPARSTGHQGIPTASHSPFTTTGKKAEAI